MSNMKNKVTMIKFTPLTLRKEYEDGDYGLLTYSIRNGYPRITVFTSNMNKTEQFDYNTMINAPFDLVSFDIFINLLEEVIKSEGEINHKINCFNIKFVNNERTNDIKLQGTVNIAKDKNGVVYLAVTEEGKRKVRFDLIPGKWHKYYKNNDLVSEGKDLSKMYAISYLNTLKRLFNQYADKGGNVDIKVNEAKNSYSNNTTKPEIKLDKAVEDDLF